MVTFTLIFCGLLLPSSPCPILHVPTTPSLCLLVNPSPSYSCYISSPYIPLCDTPFTVIFYPLLSTPLLSSLLFSFASTFAISIFHFTFTFIFRLFFLIFYTVYYFTNSFLFILFYFTLFYFILFYFILFYFILFYFILFYFYGNKETKSIFYITMIYDILTMISVFIIF